MYQYYNNNSIFMNNGSYFKMGGKEGGMGTKFHKSLSPYVTPDIHR